MNEAKYLEKFSILNKNSKTLDARCKYCMFCQNLIMARFSGGSEKHNLNKLLILIMHKFLKINLKI